MQILLTTHILKKAIRKYKLMEALSERPFRTYQELEEEVKGKKLDPFKILVKIGVQVDPYTLFILTELILPEKISIDAGIEEMKKAEECLFDVETLTWHNSDKESILKFLKEKHDLKFARMYLEYVRKYSLPVQDDQVNSSN